VGKTVGIICSLFIHWLLCLSEIWLPSAGRERPFLGDSDAGYVVTVSIAGALGDAAEHRIKSSASWPRFCCARAFTRASPITLSPAEKNRRYGFAASRRVQLDDSAIFPVIVLSAGIQDWEEDPKLDNDHALKLKLQHGLAALSAQGIQKLVDKSRPLDSFWRADSIRDAVRDVVATIRGEHK
jgi:hypothetical protein